MTSELLEDKPPPGPPTRTNGKALRRKSVNLLLPVLGISVAAVSWQVLSSLMLFSSGLPSFTRSCVRAGYLVGRLNFWDEVGTTLATATVGLALTVAITLPLGLVMALSQKTELALGTFVEILRPIPPVVYLPIAVLALGAKTRTELVLVLSGSVWPLLIQVVYGVRTVDEQRLDVADVYGLGLRERLRFVVIPGATPYILTGLRLTATICLIVTVTAEMLGTKAGLGGDMAQSQITGDNTQLFALVLVIGVIGVLVDFLGRSLEHRSLRWQQSRLEVAA